MPTADKPTWVGTGFLHGIPQGKQGRYAICLVTNKHVLQGHKKIVLRFNGQEGEPVLDVNVDLQSKNGRNIWVGHPRDDIDIAAITLNAEFLRKKKRQSKFFPADAGANRDELKNLGVSEGDGVFVLGFPMRIVGVERQYAICRSGCISRIHDMLSGSDFFLIDAFVFPGNSGGPVILKPEAIAIEGTQPQKQARLIGIVSSYLPYEDIAYSRQTDLERVRFHENSGLSLVIPVDYIHETVQLTVKRGRSRMASKKSRSKKHKV